MTHFLLKDSACAAWASSDSGISRANFDEIFNWMSPQSFLPDLTSCITTQHFLPHNDRFKRCNTPDFAKCCNSAAVFFFPTSSEWFSLVTTDILKAVGCNYQQCRVCSCIRPSGLQWTLWYHLSFESTSGSELKDTRTVPSIFSTSNQKNRFERICCAQSFRQSQEHNRGGGKWTMVKRSCT